jgi:hypothetical protein
MKSSKYFLRHFSKLDLYGVDQKLAFFHKKKYQSYFGALYSLSFMAYFIYKIISFIIKFTNKQSFSQVNNIFKLDKELNGSNLEFAHCLSKDI